MDGLATLQAPCGHEIDPRLSPPPPILKSPCTRVSGDHPMTKERHSNKETKKKPGLTLKEKRSAKKSKHEPKTTLLENVKSGLT
jgi:hypothetical protein